MLEEKILQWYEKIGKKMIMVIGVLIVAYFFAKLNILGLLSPFIVAWILAMILNPFVTWANKQLRLHRGMGTIFSMLTILTSIVSVMAFVIRKLWYQMAGFANDLPRYTEDLLRQFNVLEDRLGGVLSIMPASGAITNLDQVVEQFSSALSKLLTALIPSVYGTVAKVPDLIIFFIITLLSTFFMTKDYYFIKSFVKAQLSDTIIDRMVVMQRGLLQAIGGYLKTQLILMGITFSICFIGFLFLGIDYFLLISIIIAIVDALPVFGSGTILIPWAIYNMIIGNYPLGLGLLAIYGVIFVMRQIMEPKILSSQIGVYALVTIMAVYIGYKTIGILGLIVAPAVVVIFQMLQNVGALPKFKPIRNIDYRGERK